MADLLKHFALFTRKKGLRINFTKSKIMRMMPQRGVTGAWPIKNGKGEIDGIISEANSINYLGLQISRSAGWKLTESSKLKRLQRKAAIIKAKATCLPKRIAPASIMWQLAAKPQWEYGLECIHTSSTWQKQHKTNLQNG